MRMSRGEFISGMRKQSNQSNVDVSEIKSDRLFVIGDVHAEYELLAESLRKIPPGSAIVFLGDYNAYDGSLLLEFCSFLSGYNLQCFLIRGNHDHPVFWQQEHMRKLLQKHTGVELLGEVDALRWNNKSILTVNGAVSIDRSCIRNDEGKCWPFREGVPSVALEQIQSLVEHVGAFDVILSHAGLCEAVSINNPFTQAYASTDDTLIEDLTNERALMLRILIASGATLSAYGHFHRNCTDEIYGVSHHCLNICSVAELLLNGDGAVELHQFYKPL